MRALFTLSMKSSFERIALISKSVCYLAHEHRFFSEWTDKEKRGFFVQGGVVLTICSTDTIFKLFPMRYFRIFRTRFSSERWHHFSDTIPRLLASHTLISASIARVNIFFDWRKRINEAARVVLPLPHFQTNAMRIEIV